MSADESGTKGQEVPLGPGRLEHLERVDTDLVKDDSELVDERNVQVALGVLDDLRRFGDLDAACPVHAGLDDAAVDFRHPGQGFRRIAGDDLGDLGQRMLLVPGVDAFRRVAREEVFLP